MTVSSTPPLLPSGEDGADPVTAFRGVIVKIAGLNAKMDGFAARQEDLFGRDYTADFTKTHEMHDKVRKALYILNDRPAMALTPEIIAAQIEKAGATVRQRDHQVLAAARQELAQVAFDLKGVTASARDAKMQNKWLAGAAAMGVAIGIVIAATVPGATARSVPERWHWPERKAADMLHMDVWDAGERMLQVGDPGKWRSLVAMARIGVENEDALKACGDKAAKAKKAVKCELEVGERSTK